MMQLFLELLDDAWSHRFESLMPAIAGLEAAEASWQPPGYNSLEATPGVPLPGTILWHLTHVERYSRHYTSVLQVRGGCEPTEPAQISATDLPTVLSAAERSHAALRQSVARLSEVDLDALCTSNMAVSEFLRMVIRHITWH